MKRVLKILAWLLGLFFLLLLAGIVAIQSPFIQTKLADWVTGKLEERIPAQVSFGLLTVRPFDALVLEDVLIADPTPYVQGMDTVIHVRNLTAKFSLSGLFSGNGAQVRKLKLDGGQFNLGYEPDEQDIDGMIMNLYRVLGLEEKGSDKASGWGKLLSARSLEVKNFRFRMANPVKSQEMEQEGRGYGEGAIDWNDFSVWVYEILATHIDLADNHILGAVERLRAREEATGFSLDELSAQKVDVGEACVNIEGLHIRSEATDLYLNELVMDGPIDEYSDFIDRIWLQADIRPGSFLSLPTVRYFADGVSGITFASRIQGQVQGYVDDFKLENLILEDPVNEVLIQLNGRMSGLPDTDGTQLDFQVRKLDFALDRLGGFVQAWAPETRLDLSKLAQGELFHFQGRINGPLDHMHIEGDIDSAIGSVDTDLILSGAVDPQQTMTIGGRVTTEDLHLGKITGAQALGQLSLKSGLQASFPRGGDMQVSIDSLHISKLGALGYNYTNLSAAGTYSEKAFNGRIIAADPNLNFLFQGLFNLSRDSRNAAYRFYASLGYADLHALHLDKRERSKISFQASSNFLRTEKRDLLGDVKISGISLESETGRHDIGNISVHAYSNDNVSRIRLESPFLEGSYVGDAGPGTFLNDLQYLVLDRDVPALLANKPDPWEGATYNVNLVVKAAQGLLSFLVPGLYVEKNSSLDLNIDEDGLVTATVRSGRVALNDKFIKDFLLSFDNGNQVQTASITGKQISLSGTQILNNRLTLFADDNQFGLGYSFDNEEEGTTRAELYLSGDLSRDENGLAIAARALPSNIYYKGNGWGLSSQEITYCSGNFHVDRLMASHNDETLLIHGGLSSGKADTLSVQMDKFDIGLVNSFGGNLPSLEGHATGHALILSSASPSVGLIASITCDSTFVAGQRLGQLQLSSLWDEENSRFNATVQNQLNGKQNLHAQAFLQPDTRAVHASAHLDRLNMAYAAPLLDMLFSQFGGALSGEVGVDGTLDRLHLSSRDLRIDDGLLELDFTRVPYHMAGDIALDDKGLHFQNVSLDDRLGGKGAVTGGILFSGFKDMSLDTHVQFSNLKVLDIPRGVNDLLYGNATATGLVDVTGPLNRILLNVNAYTSREGNIHIALGSGGGDRSREMLTFTLPPDEQEPDPYEVMMSARSQEKSERSDLRVKLRIRATPELQLGVDVDQESSLSAQGAGTVELESRVSTGSFSLTGDYNISRGNFLFSAMHLVTRKFTIQDGSTIRFNGEIMDTDLDIKGLYTTKASLSTLISDQTAASRRTVNCGINITGRLRNPEVNFTIDIPDLNPATQAQVDAALNTVDKVQKQFVYLLLAGNFLPAEESGVTTGGTDALFSNVSSIMSNQINNIFQKLNIPLDMGLNYQTTQTGSNLFDVALSTQLFNNRVIVNGTVGNKQMLGGTTTNEVAGDIDIEIKLNRSGSLRVKLFSHSADIYTSYLDNSQRHGGGFSYQRDFNSFLHLLKMIFTKREKREEMARQEVLDMARTTVLQVDREGKITRE